MSARTLVWLLLAAGPVFAQLDLVAVINNVEQPVGTSYDFGRVATNETRTLSFRMKNATANAVEVNRFNVSGAGFTLTSILTPFTVAAGRVRDFNVSFRGTAPATYSANLQINSLNTLLIATVEPGADLTVAPACKAVDASTIDFGNIPKGQTRTCAITLTNASASVVSIAALRVSGEGFTAPDAPASLTLNAGQAASFNVLFTPPSAAFYRGTLQVGNRSYVIGGAGTLPAISKPTLNWESTAVASAQQRRLTVTLPEPSPLDATGVLTMTLLPQTSGLQDPTVLFPITGSPHISYTLKAGSTQVLLNQQASALFQTGTTAGVIRFTFSSVGPGFASDPSAELIIPAVPVVFDSIKWTQRAGSFDLDVIGYDNTYSTGAMTFTFFDTSGGTIATVRPDFTREFQTFYASSTGGSVFEMLLRFPATGDQSRVGSVIVELSNSAGTRRSERLNFQ